MMTTTTFTATTTVKNQYTKERDQLPYDYHYKFGIGNNSTDIDCIEYHTEKNYTTVYDAIIDYKNGLHSNHFLNPLDPYQQNEIKTKYSTLRRYIDIANNKFNVPFFVVYTYLEDYFDGYRMMAVIPGNQLAVDFFAKITNDEPDINGCYWMTLKMYAKMLLKLKNLKLNDPDVNNLDDNYHEYKPADLYKIKLKIAEDKCKKDLAKKLCDEWLKNNHPELICS